MDERPLCQFHVQLTGQELTPLQS